jgi:hypothetical protein
MIKRYNQFVKERINENVDMEEEVLMDTDSEMEDDMEMDSEFQDDMEDDMEMDSEFQDDMEDEMEKDSEVQDDMEDDMDFEDEEEGFDIYKTKMEELAKLLGVEVDETNKISFEGKEIIFPSETEMYHVDKKKFKTAQEVVDYLNK